MSDISCGPAFFASPATGRMICGPYNPPKPLCQGAFLPLPRRGIAFFTSLTRGVGGVVFQPRGMSPLPLAGKSSEKQAGVRKGDGFVGAVRERPTFGNGPCNRDYTPSFRRMPESRDFAFEFVFSHDCFSWSSCGSKFTSALDSGMRRNDDQNRRTLLAGRTYMSDPQNQPLPGMTATGYRLAGGCVGVAYHATLIFSTRRAA